jgi:hypothetical protein
LFRIFPIVPEQGVAPESLYWLWESTSCRKTGVFESSISVKPDREIRPWERIGGPTWMLRVCAVPQRLPSIGSPSF